MKRFVKAGMAVTGSLVAVCAQAQISDLLNTYDAGTRSFGAGSSLTATDSETMSTFNNPAGLGYLTHREIGFSYKNLPDSNSTVSDAAGDRSSTSNHTGGSTLPEVGFVLPLSSKSNRGTLGFLYNIGGYLSDAGTASSFAYGTGSNLTAANYSDKLYSRTDYFTVGYGRTNQSQNMSYGIAFTYASESLQYEQQYGVYDTSTSTPVLVSSVNTGLISGTSSGVGVIAGFEMIPDKDPNLSLGASVRSPINLSGGDGITSYYSEIPGRILAGGGYRLSGAKSRNDDYMVVGAQIEQYFGGSASGPFSFNNQTAGDFGVEYGYTTADFVVPFRFGFRTQSSAGYNFSNRNEFTYGIGYRDKSNHYSIDFNIGNPQGAALDFSVTASYRFVNP